MAVSFPIPVAEFIGTFRVHALTMEPGSAVNVAQTGGGELLPSKVGTRLWAGAVTMTSRRHDDSAALEAMISLLEEPGASFYMSDVRRPGPTYDPNGLVLGAATPTIATLASNNRELGIQGLPVSYVLSRGDMIAFDYLSSPIRHALHRVFTGGIADSSGIISNIEVTPHIRPGAAVGAAITLHKAACKTIIVPGSVTPPQRLLSGSTAISFKFQQTLR